MGKKKENSIRINSIKFSDGIPHIVYDENTELGKKGIELDSDDKAQKDFKEAWDSLTPHFIDIAELPKTWTQPYTENGSEKAQIVIRGISFSYSKERETMGIVISATRELAHSQRPLNISSPLKSLPDVDRTALTGDSSIYLSKACEDVLDLIIAEAIAYINGKRLGEDQIDAFVEPPPKDSVNDLDITEEKAKPKTSKRK